MHVAESAVGSPVHTGRWNLDREKHNLVPAAEEFSAKIDVVQKRTTEIGHVLREEEDLH